MISKAADLLGEPIEKDLADWLLAGLIYGEEALSSDSIGGWAVAHLYDGITHDWRKAARGRAS